MGGCASCLRARKKTTRSYNDEARPLLEESHDNNAEVSEDTSEQYQQRQQELVQIVQSTYEHFIDILSVSNTEHLSPSKDLSEIKALIRDRLGQVQLKIPDSKDLSEQGRKRLELALKK